MMTVDVEMKPFITVICHMSACPPLGCDADPNCFLQYCKIKLPISVLV